MAHSHAKHKEHQASHDRVHKMYGKFARGGAAKHDDEAQDRKLIKKVMKEEKPEMKAHGGKTKARMDKYARGGKTKGGHKGHHTKINIVVAPKGGGADVPPPPMGGPPGAGAPPPGAGAPPMMPPKVPMGPPPGGPMGGPPGLGMKRGGGVRPHSGIASPENLKKWSEYAAHGTKYARGGGIINPATGGAESGSGRLAEHKHYAKGKK